MGIFDGYDPNVKMIDILGPPAYNNLDEPLPWANHIPTLEGLILTSLILAWLFVCFRLFVRLRILKAPGLDDLFVFLFLIFGSLTSAMLLLSIKFGEGQHMLYLRVGDFLSYLKTVYVMNGTINMATTFIKLSILFQYLRLFKKGSWPYNASLGGIVFVSLWGLSYTILAWIPCQRISDYWDPAVDSVCWGYMSPNHDIFLATFVSHTVINMLLDLYITILPFQLYFDPTTSNKTRKGLFALLLFGVIVNIFAAWRLQAVIYHQVGWWPTQDPSWYGTPMALLAVIEVNLASVCASIPIFWPMLRLPRMGDIFVTREVIVSRKDRTDLVREDTKSEHEKTSETEYEEHYRDAHVMEHVAPFAKNESSSTTYLGETTVEAGGNMGRRESESEDKRFDLDRRTHEQSFLNLV